MNKVDKILAKFKGLSANFEKITSEVLNDNSHIILDLNIAQLEIGITSENEFVSPEYASEEYADYKQSIGSKSPKGTPDLKLEGDFHSGFNMKINNDLVIIDSSDPKTPDLEDKYGAEIFGLTEDSKKELKPFLIESLKEKFKIIKESI